MPLGPMCKLGAIAVCTRETIEGGSADTVIPQLLQESAALSLDVSVFLSLRRAVSLVRPRPNPARRFAVPSGCVGRWWGSVFQDGVLRAVDLG